MNIALISETPGFFTDKDLKMLDQIGAHISLAIVNSFLNQEIREEKEKTLNILERLDEGIFEAEVREPISADANLEVVALSFYASLWCYTSFQKSVCIGSKVPVT